MSPNTVTGGDNGPGYSYEMRTIEGFAMTQMSGVGWYGDLGNFLVMPTTGPLKTVAGKEDGSLDGMNYRFNRTKMLSGRIFPKGSRRASSPLSRER